MNILAAIKREEKKLEKQMSKLQHQLNGIRIAKAATICASISRPETRRTRTVLPSASN
jgi:hypothetical protein